MGSAVEDNPDGVELIALDQLGHGLLRQVLHSPGQHATEKTVLRGQRLLDKLLDIRRLEQAVDHIGAHGVGDGLVPAQRPDGRHPTIGVENSAPQPESYIADRQQEQAQHDQHADSPVAPPVLVHLQRKLLLLRLLPQLSHLSLQRLHVYIRLTGCLRRSFHLHLFWRSLRALCLSIF